MFIIQHLSNLASFVITSMIEETATIFDNLCSLKCPSRNFRFRRDYACCCVVRLVYMSTHACGIHKQPQMFHHLKYVKIHRVYVCTNVQ